MSHAVCCTALSALCCSLSSIRLLVIVVLISRLATALLLFPFVPVAQVVTATETVVGDVRDNLNRLLPFVKYNDRPEWFSQINEWKAKFPFSYEPAAALGAIKPQRVVEEFYRAVCTKTSGWSDIVCMCACM